MIEPFYSRVGSSLEFLRDQGFAPKAAVDIGACVGEWTTIFRQVFPTTPVLMIEPQTKHIERLQQVRASCMPAMYAQVLVGRSIHRSVPFWVLDDDLGTGSSMLPERTNCPRHVVYMSMTTLDDLVETDQFPAPDLLKLDVQGYELEVLAGATRILPEVQVIQLEVSVWEYNEGAPLIAEVFAWMTSHGFVLFDLCTVYRLGNTPLLNQLDLIFVRRESLVRNPKGVI